MVPINFRLLAHEVAFIIEDSGAVALVVEDVLLGCVEQVRGRIELEDARIVHLGHGQAPAGYREYEALIAEAAETEPHLSVAPHDPWALMYTSGTTGRPKGAIRSHKGAALLSLVTEVELGFSRRDMKLLEPAWLERSDEGALC